MRVAGIGFRRDAPLSSLTEVLARLGPVDVLATARDKAPALRDLIARLGFPVLAVDVAGIITPTQSPRVLARFATGSVAEAAALAALAPGARLIQTRIQSHDGMATCALAEGDPA